MVAEKGDGNAETDAAAAVETIAQDNVAQADASGAEPSADADDGAKDVPTVLDSGGDADIPEEIAAAPENRKGRWHSANE